MTAISEVSQTDSISFGDRLCHNWDEILDGIEIKQDISEDVFSLVSAIPILGTTTSAYKIVRNVAASMVFFVLGAVFILPTPLYKLKGRVFTLWKHSCANIFVSIFEAMPIVQTGLYMYRRSRIPNVSDYKLHVFTGHEHKFMPYPNLVSRDWEFDGTDEELVSLAKNSYEAKVLEMGGESKLSIDERLSIARGIVAHCLKE